MDAPSPDDLAELANAYARAGRPVHEAHNMFLIRVGDDFGEYPFSWEPFRDLAGPMQPTESSRPIVFESGTGPRSTVLVEQVAYPAPHVRILIAPEVPVARIVDAWVGQFRLAGHRAVEACAMVS